MEGSVNGEGVRKASQGAFKQWKEKSTIVPEDDAGTKIKKLFIRIGGVILMIALSPALILFLIVSFLVAL